MDFNFPWLTKIPNSGKCLFFVDVKENTELSVEFDCLWADPQPGSNILLVIKGQFLSQNDAGLLGFTASAYGYYKYIKHLIKDGRICIDFILSSAVQEVWLIPFCIQNPVYIKGLKCRSDQFVNVRPALASTIEPDAAAVNVPNEAVAINANILKHACGDACCIHFNKWFDSMDGFASRWGEHLGRDSLILREKTYTFPAVLHRGSPALLKVPKDISEWMFEIGDKSRNMISKARRLGYYFKDVDPSEVGQGIYEVRTSDPMRQGRSIPEYFYTNPPKFVVDRSKVGCRQHDEVFVGVFWGDKLVSYITLFVFGQLAEINHILCHKDHLNNGVMNFNLYCVVNFLIENNTDVRYLNYLYVSENKSTGIDLFKKSMGFKSRKLFIYDGLFDLVCNDALMAREVIKVKKERRGDEIKNAAKKFKPNPNLNTLTGSISSNLEVSSILGVESDRIVFVAPPDAKDFVKFWSSEVSFLAQSFPVGTFMAIPFPRRCTVDDEVGQSNYLKKRFKANPVVGIEGLRCGFKGGIFRLAALLNYAGEDDSNENLLVLEKVAG